MFDVGLDDDRHASGEGHFGRVGHKTGLGDDDLISRVEHGIHDEIKRLADPNGDQNLGVGVIADAIQPFQVGYDGTAQLWRAAVAGVMGVPRFQGANSSTDDGVGRDEVWLAYAQGDHIVHVRADVKEFANA